MQQDRRAGISFGRSVDKNIPATCSRTAKRTHIQQCRAGCDKHWQATRFPTPCSRFPDTDIQKQPVRNQKDSGRVAYTILSHNASRRWIVGSVAKRKFQTTAMAAVCGDLPPAAILRKGNARCALAKTLAKLTKALALVYSLFAACGRGGGLRALLPANLKKAKRAAHVDQNLHPTDKSSIRACSFPSVP